jgi:hypothetical protein
MKEPWNPHTKTAYRLAMDARRNLCWCNVLRDAQQLWMIGLGLTAIWSDPRNLRLVPSVTCAYCKADIATDSADFAAHREWYSYSYPGDPDRSQPTHGYCEHGLDGPHQHCEG